MKALIASMTALAVIAAPAVAQTSNTMSNTTKASKAVVKEAKAEGESVATEAKEHKAAARHHRRHHAKRMHKRHHAAKKTAKATTTSTKKPD